MRAHEPGTEAWAYAEMGGVPCVPGKLAVGEKRRQCVFLMAHWKGVSVYRRFSPETQWEMLGSILLLP